MKKIFLLLFTLTAGAFAADQTGAFPKYFSSNGNQVPVLMHDNGDGTWSLSTSASGAASGLTDTQLRATPVPVSGTVTVGSITIGQLPASLGIKTAAASLSIAPASDATFAVTGTFFQATQPVSIATAPVLVAGSAIIGKVSIDQTTPGTTNAVALISGQNGVAAGSGATGATTLRTISATDSPDVTSLATIATNTTTSASNSTTNTTTLGATTDAAVGDATGSINAHLRQLAITTVDGVVTGPTSVTSATTIFSVDTAGNPTAIVQVSSAGSSCTVTYETCNDNSTWYACAGYSIQGGAMSSSTTTAQMAVFPAIGRYFRARVSTYGSGTVTASVSLRKTAMPYNSVNATLSAAVANNDGVTFGSSFPATVLNTVFNGATSDRLRTPNIFKTVSATASGNTSLWAGTSAKKHRIMKLLVQVSADAATSGGADIVVDIQDVTTTTNLTFTVFVPAVAATALGPGWTSGWVDLGNGNLCAATNTAVNVNLSAALTSGVVRVIMAGTDE